MKALALSATAPRQRQDGAARIAHAALAVVAGANRMLLLAGQPAGYAAAMAGALAETAMLAVYAATISLP